MSTSPQSPTWLITGTSAGLGLSLSQHILRKGHNLISTSRRPSPDPALIALAKTYHPPNTSSPTTPDSSPTLHHIPLDLSDPSPNTIPQILVHFLQSHPTISIDILINNAAITTFSPLEYLTPANLTTVLTTNFLAPTYLIQSLLPHMRTVWSNNGHEKVIVNVSSTQGLCTDPSECGYDSSKHALEGMSGVLAAEVAKFGMRVVVVSLGSLRTGFAKNGEEKEKEKEKERQRQRRGEQGQGRQEEGEGEGGVQSGVDDSYADPSHPVAKRMAAVRKLVDVPGLARGDPGKTAAVLFDAVMRTEGSVVDGVLEMQRARTLEDAAGSGIGRVERLVLGSDAQPKIERVLDRVRFDVESCRVVSGLIEADK